MERRVELLAPAGNREAFFGAVHAGADAVYLAGERFGARAYADNFTTEELVECIRYAHLWKRKVYLTVNTLVKESEFPELYSYLLPFYKAGLDGVIVQDIGVFTYIRRHFPELPLHVSTQMTLTGRYGAAMLKRLGAVRIVPARELSLAEIKALKEATGLEVETFIHGAMCYCYSGQCLFSSILGGRSGNRGRCAQPCRLPYQVLRDGKCTKECYPLSLKDMCTIERIPELIEAGIDSFKIEGRMKKAEYAAGVTAIYRKYIDRYYRGEACYRVEPRDLEALAELYIRSERQEGYYFKHNGADMITLDSPSYSGSNEELLAGIRAEYLEKKPRIPVEIFAKFRVGEAAEIRLQTAAGTDPDKRCGEPVCVSVCSEAVSQARRQPITQDNIRKQLGKLGDTVFEAVRIFVAADEDAFYSLKAINEMRRQAASLLEDALIAQNGFGYRDPDGAPDAFPDSCSTKDPHSAKDPHSMEQVHGAGGFHIALRSVGQWQAVMRLLGQPDREAQITRIYLEADLLSDLVLESAEPDRAESFLGQCLQTAASGCELILALPTVLRKRDDLWLEQIWDFYGQHRDCFSGFLVRSFDGLGFLTEHGCSARNGDRLYADAGFYLWNRSALQNFFAPDAEVALRGFCMPYELNAAEQRRILAQEDAPCEKIVYGRIPLMTTANCIANTIDGCSRSDGEKAEDPKTEYVLIDRYRKAFPVVRSCRHCWNILYNSLPLSLHGELSKWRNKADLRLDFTIEDEAEVQKILFFFLGGTDSVLPYKEYTTGHEKRGVE